MRHILLLGVSILLALTAFPNSFSFGDSSGTQATLNYRVIDENAKTCEVIRGSSTGSSYYIVGGQGIPSVASINGVNYTVTAIGDQAFFDCDRMTSITLPTSITSIGDSAFSGCSGLTSITLPTSITSIGNGIFSGCSGLTSITLPTSITSIGNGIFSSCSGLTSITLPTSITSIGDHAFSNCSGLTSITLPTSITSIGKSAFYGCSGLTSVNIPESVSTIGSDAFIVCNSLETIYYNARNCYIDATDREKVFPSNIKNLVIGENVESIPNYAFTGIGDLTSVTIPNSVTSIGRGAFNGCI